MTDAFHQEDSRASSRHALRLRANLRSESEVCQGEVVDLSRDGAKVVTDRTWSIGEEVRLTMDLLGSCRGHVIWSQDGAIGIRFADEFVMLTLLVGGWCALGG